MPYASSRTKAIICIVFFSILVLRTISRFNTTRSTNEDYQFHARLKGPLDGNDPAVVTLFRKEYLYEPSTRPYNLTDPRDNVYHLNSHSFGWKFIRHYTEQIFIDQEKGIFVEAGALDGEFLSNTLWLEQQKGWSGLLVEADPMNFECLVWKRRKSWISPACLSPESYPHETIIESLQRVSKSFAPSWLYRANSRKLEDTHSPISDDFLKSSSTSYAKVQCFPMTTFLSALNVTTVDFLSLDIQGKEWEIIKSLPFEKVRFRVLAVEHYMKGENKTDNKNTDTDFISYMDKIGYRFLERDDEPNYIFVLKNDTRIRTNYEPFPTGR